jgi:hypothetical protein
MIERVLSGVPLNVSFRRHLIENNLVLWHHLVTRIMHIHLNNVEDVFRWKLHQHGTYFVHSLYLAMINNGLAVRNNMICDDTINITCVHYLQQHMRPDVA